MSSVVAPDAGTVTLDVVTVNGSGCPAGTTAVGVSPDGEAFTVIYGQYTALVSPPATSAERNCQLGIRVNAPSAFTYAIAETNHRGYRALSEGAAGQLLSRYYFQGQSQTAYLQHPIPQGTGEWQVTEEVPLLSMVYAPCGQRRNLNLNTRLVARQGGSVGESYVTMDSTDVEFSTRYVLSWRRCA